MLAAAAKRAKLAFFDDPYRSLASNSHKSKKKNIKKTYSFCKCAFQTLDDNVSNARPLGERDTYIYLHLVVFNGKIW